MSNFQAFFSECSSEFVQFVFKTWKFSCMHFQIEAPISMAVVCLCEWCLHSVLLDSDENSVVLSFFRASQTMIYVTKWHVYLTASCIFVLGSWLASLSHLNLSSSRWIKARCLQFDALKCLGWKMLGKDSAQMMHYGKPYNLHKN